MQNDTNLADSFPYSLDPQNAPRRIIRKHALHIHAKVTTVTGAFHDLLRMMIRA